MSKNWFKLVIIKFYIFIRCLNSLRFPFNKSFTIFTLKSIIIFINISVRVNLCITSAYLD